MQTVTLCAEGRRDRVRLVMVELQGAVGNDARVWGYPEPGGDDEHEYRPFSVDVFEAADQAAAIEWLVPAIREADPDLEILTGFGERPLV